MLIKSFQRRRATCFVIAWECMGQFGKIISDNKKIYTLLVSLSMHTSSIGSELRMLSRGARSLGSGVFPTNMTDDVTFHPYPEEPLPGEGKRTSLSLVTTRVM